MSPAAGSLPSSESRKTSAGNLPPVRGERLHRGSHRGDISVRDRLKRRSETCNQLAAPQTLTFRIEEKVVRRHPRLETYADERIQIGLP